MANSADPDQLASLEANWSGSTLFAKQGISGFSRTRVNGEQVYSHSPSYPKDSVWPAWANSVAQIKQAHLDLHYLPFSQHFVLLFSFNCETNESLTSVLLNPDIPSFANSVDLKKPTDLDLHCLPLSMWIYNNNLDQVIWLAEN